MILFPSPLGEMGLSIASFYERKVERYSYKGFRPLSGKWGYRYHVHVVLSHKPLLFPSPLGEMGLSIFRMVPIPHFFGSAPVSVPSRGNGVIDTLSTPMNASSARITVSVPSRGNGVIDLRAGEQ